jgi:PAS domain S-box-containing protein
MATKEKAQEEKAFLEEPDLELGKETRQTTEALLNMLEDVEESRGKAETERDKTLAVIENFTDGLLLFDEKNRLSLSNPQAETFLRVKEQDIVGKNTDELARFPRIKLLTALLAEEIKSLFRKEVKINENLILEVSAIPVLHKEKRMGTLVILHDVTREKEIERMKTEFVSIAAHQLRTPLSAIKWTLKMLLGGDLGKITDTQRDFVGKTYQANERMIDLINDLLDVTRIEEGRYLYKPVLTNLETIVEFVVKSQKEELEKKNLKLEYKKPKKELPKIMLDVDKIRLAIQNIIDNAIKYTKPGGWIEVSFKHTKNEIEFLIKDSGVGIPKDQQNRVFTKFFRGANVMRMETEGSGLGLFITKNIIEAHGGRIWFESKVGKGTTFHFILPAKKEFEKFIEGL